MSYQFLNTIYRALDSFTHPHDFNTEQRIQGIRILLENHSYQTKCRLIPNKDILIAGLRALHGQTTRQNIREINDIYLTMNIGQVDDLYANLRNTEKVHNPTSLNSIANDKHNVHNSAINNSVKQVAVHLVEDFPTQNCDAVIKSLVAKLKTLNKWSKNVSDTLVFITRSKVHFNINITLKEMLSSLYLWIKTHKGETRDELFNRLIEELIDMNGNCSTGHMARIVNVPQGYTENSRYLIGINTEEEINKSVRNMITYSLRTASEEVIDGILDKTDAYIQHIDTTAEKLMDEWITAYGEEYMEQIQTIIEEFKSK